MTEKELEKLFRSKLSHQHFEFNPQNWEAMEAMLNSPQRKVGAYWWQSAAILAFGLVVGLSLLTRNAVDGPLIEQNNVAGQPAEIKPLQNTPSSNNADKSAGAVKEEAVQSPIDEPTAESAAQEVVATSETSAPEAISLSAGSGNAQPLLRETYVYSQPGVKSFNPFSALTLPTQETVKFTYPEAPAAELTVFEPEALPKFDNRHEIALQGGPSVNSSFAGSAGAGWNIGLMYRHRLSPKISLSTGALYNRTGDMGISTETDSVFFGFGRTEVHTEKTYKNVASIRFPLEVEYHLSPAHTVSAGGYAEVVTAVQMDMERTTHAFKSDPVTESHSNSKNREEFNDFNAGLRAGYTYRLTPQFSFGVNVNYGLTDLTNDRVKGFEENHRLFQTELIVRYRLF